MNNERPNLGFGGELDEFDPDAWNSTDNKKHNLRPSKAASQQMAEAAGFKSREPKLASAADSKIDRRRRTGSPAFCLARRHG